MFEGKLHRTRQKAAGRVHVASTTALLRQSLICDGICRIQSVRLWRESAYSTERMRQNRPEREVWSMGFGRGGRGVLGPPRISEFDILPLTFQSQNVFLLVSEVAKRNLAIVAPGKNPLTPIILQTTILSVTDETCKRVVQLSNYANNLTLCGVIFFST